MDLDTIVTDSPPIGEALRNTPEYLRQRITTLESSHAELLEALKRIYGTLSFYEDSEEKLDGIKNRVVLINAEGPEGDFQDMLLWAREALKRAEEEK